MHFAFASALLFAVSAIAAPTGELVERQSSTTCGNTYYSSSHVRSAVNQGSNYYANGQQVGAGNYPHQYNNYEGQPIDGKSYTFDGTRLTHRGRLRLPRLGPVSGVPYQDQRRLHVRLSRR